MSTYIMKKSKIILFILFLLVFAIRLYFSFQTQGFLTDESYFHIRQINHILESGFPLLSDDLLPEGRVFIFSPLFDYVLAFFSLFAPIEIAAKIISNLFAASLIISIYLFVHFFTKNNHVALVSALISGFIPIFVGETFASISVYPLAFTLILFLLYNYFNLPKNLGLFVTTLFILIFLHPISLIFVLGLCFYYILIVVEGVTREKWEFEVVLFSLFLGLWAHFLIYKDALLLYGKQVFWQNIPSNLLSVYFTDITILEALIRIGIIPFVGGIFIIWKYLFRKKSRYIHLLIAFTLISALLLWLKLITPKIGLILLSFFFVLLFAQFYVSFLAYLQSTRFGKYEKLVQIAVILVFIFTSVFPSLSYSQEVIQNSFIEEEIQSLEWLKENTQENAVIMALPQEGNLIEAIAQRKTVLDTHFISIADAEERFNDIQTFYTTPSRIQAVEIQNKYNVKYVYFSPAAQKMFGLEKLAFLHPLCFVPIYDKEVFIYKAKCEVEQIG